MEKIPVGIKRLAEDNDLCLPEYASAGSSGMDIRAFVQEPVVLNPGEIKLIPTGLAVSLPPGYEAQIRPRSGLALTHGIGMVNSPGTIDSDYRGEIGIILINWGAEPFIVRKGDRIAQMIVGRVFQAEFFEIDQLDQTSRGHEGFGHTGIR
ncbi:MAG: dUTP diphosphatase [Deltaproteobacteria bacterium]|nr:MAG: dUTP diphosphatase [Deltaproteobacteria bacterium]